MASFSENRTSWKIRFYNSRRTPKEKVISLPKESWSKTDAKRRWRELEVAFDRGEYDPWTGADYAGSGKTLMDAAEEFIALKTAAGRRGQRGGWNEHTASRHGSVIRDLALCTGPADPAAYLTSEQLEAFIFRADLRHESRATYRRIIGPFIQWLRDMKTPRTGLTGGCGAFSHGGR